MFIHGHLHPKDYRHYERALARSYQVQWEIDILDGNEDPIGSFTSPDKRISSGQVDIDTTQPVTRHLTLDCADLFGKIVFEPRSPSAVSLYADRMIRATRGVYVPQLGHQVFTPVFFGPVSNFHPRGVEVHVEAQGKESLLLDPHFMWRTMSWRKGYQIVKVIQEILEAKGETRFNFPHIDRGLPKHFSIHMHQEPWKVCKQLAHSINRQLFYDGRGVPTLRQHSQDPVWSFHDGREGMLMSVPDFNYDITEMRNLVEILGPKPTGKSDKKKRIRAVAVLDDNNPFSPESLAWNGKPRYLVDSEEIQEPEKPDKNASDEKKRKYKQAMANRKKHAQEIADRKLEQLSKQHIDVTYDVVAVAELEEMDMVELSYNGDVIKSYLTQSTLAMVGEPEQTIGYLRRVSPRDRKKHAKKR